MSKLTRKNLQLFCRICLEALRPNAETIYNVHLVPSLTKLLIICTSMDVNEDDDIYPKSLCQLCYDRLQDFQSFRSMALRSVELLHGIINGVEGDDVGTTVENEVKRRRTLDDESALKIEHNDDDQLLLPELSALPFSEKSIKCEPIDIEDQGLQASYINLYHHQQQQQQQLQNTVKNEIDSDYEDNTTFYENNTLGTNYHSTEDDDEDDETALNDADDEAFSRGSNFNAIKQQQTSSQRRHARKQRDRNKKSLKCSRCDKQVYKQIYLDAHVRAVHEGHEKPFLCQQCDKAFTRYNQLHVHIQSVHLKNDKFACEFEGCDAMFKMMNTLETHRKVVHIPNVTPDYPISLQQVLELHQTQLNKEIELEHICQQCSKKYSSKRALTEHLKRHANIKDYKCQVCGVAKVTRTELQTHMRTHEPNAEKFKCNICPQEFNHKNAIQRHVRVVHEGLRPFPCTFCPKRFGTRNSKMCHERLHTGEKPFVCEICNKGFAQSEGLKSHMKNHDKSLRTHVCRFCAQRFITRKNLIDHESRHRGDKPHICEICSRGFFKHEDMLLHRKSHEELGGGGEQSGRYNNGLSDTGDNGSSSQSSN